MDCIYDQRCMDCGMKGLFVNPKEKIKYMLQLLRNYINKKRRNKKCALLQKEGINSLNAYYRVGQILNVHFDVMFGTLLGVYRNHSFIPHDDDIDMVCDIEHLNKQFLDTLRNEGFEFDRIYVASDRKGVQLPMKYNGLTSDIYFMYNDSKDKIKHIFIPMAFEGKDWGYSNNLNIYSVKDIIIPYVDERCKLPFCKMEIEVFSNAKEVLETIYGKDFMVPKENAHANPPVRYFDLGEKYYTCYPIDLFEESGLLNYIIKTPI